MGAHTYAATGAYEITVEVEGLDDVEDSDTSSAQVGGLLAGIEAELIVATFETLDPTKTVEDFVATIDWGDGTSNSSAEELEPGEEPWVWITYDSGVTRCTADTLTPTVV